MTVYHKNLKSNKLFYNGRIKTNSFIPSGLEIIIESLTEDMYILGVSYEHGDSQICISGHPKKGETLLEGCRRELSEELFISFDKQLEPILTIGINSFFLININETYFKYSYENKKEKDLKNRAVVCVFGKEKDISEYIKKVTNNDLENDGIDGIWAARKNKMLSLIKSVKNSN